MITLVTGGAGFIGSNVVHRLLAAGERVRLLDDLSRPNVERNVSWLKDTHGAVDLVVADVRDERAMRDALDGVGHVFHFAAQVAVTTSLVDPVHDFEVNARGTLAVLEAIRASGRRPSILFTSTNKVYGSCADVALERRGERYIPADPHVRASGVSEARPLEFHSPYGCAKGCADQYVLDWARTYEIPTCVFRMSCIYGPRQFGNEDQGWVAHFLLQALRDEPITVYGDGRQVRDVLYADDLVDAMLLARGAMKEVAGHAFNVGGGAGNTVSLLELLEHIEGMLGRRPRVRFEPWRLADQRWYVSDVRKIARALAWQPRTPPRAGLERLLRWLESSGLSHGSHGRAPEEVRA